MNEIALRLAARIFDKPLITNKNLPPNFTIEAVGDEASSLPKHCLLVGDAVRVVVDPAVISGNDTRVGFESNPSSHLERSSGRLCVSGSRFVRDGLLASGSMNDVPPRRRSRFLF